MTARRATIQDVARRAGVSTATVSFVLREVRSVRPQVRDAVLTAAADLDYRPNRVAASPRHNNTMTIGVVVPDLQNAFFMGVVQRVEARAHADGYKILLASSEEDADREGAHIEGLLDRRVNGLVVFPTLDDPPLRAGIDSLVVPVVFVDRGLDATETDTVAIDNAVAARAATRHLIERATVTSCSSSRPASCATWPTAPPATTRRCRLPAWARRRASSRPTATCRSTARA